MSNYNKNIDNSFISNYLAVVTLKINRQRIRDNIPCTAIVPDKPKGAAVIIHGYGGSKEEQLGLSWRIAENGIAAYTIDLRGHGEHVLPLTAEIVSDVETVIKYLRPFGKVVAVGHSLGGRLALISSADYAIAISPALQNEYGAQTSEILKSFRRYRVKYESPDEFLEVFSKIPKWQPGDRKALILYGSRDIPEIIAACSAIMSNAAMIKVEGALHNDIYLQEATYAYVNKYLTQWL